eukprot:scaffold62713_cov29-Tisochrysis_lutea.AAC.2
MTNPVVADLAQNMSSAALEHLRVGEAHTDGAAEMGHGLLICDRWCRGRACRCRGGGMRHAN